MKVSVMRKVEARIEVPDHFTYDDAPRGKIVDILTGDEHYYSRKPQHALRARLTSTDDAAELESILGQLEKAYETADRIIAVLAEAAATRG